ncbi:hypothetical protein [Nocardia asteroides]
MRSYRLLIILLAIVIAVVIGAFIMVIDSDTDNDTEGQPLATTTTARAATTPPGSRATRPPTVDLYGNRLEVAATDAGAALPQTGKPVAATRADYLTTAPEGLRWQRIWDGAAVPVSAGDGPTHIVDGVASGFARTPQGAVLAGLDALGRALAAPDGVWQRVLRERYYSGDQADALIARFQRSRSNTADSARYVVVPDGVRVRAGFAPDMAVVEVASRSGAGYAVSAWPMVWVDGDWRLRVPDDLESLWRSTGTQVASLTGFGNWKPRP